MLKVRSKVWLAGDGLGWILGSGFGDGGIKVFYFLSSISDIDISIVEYGLRALSSHGRGQFSKRTAQAQQ